MIWDELPPRKKVREAENFTQRKIAGNTHAPYGFRPAFSRKGEIEKKGKE